METTETGSVALERTAGIIKKFQNFKRAPRYGFFGFLYLICSLRP